MPTNGISTLNYLQRIDETIDIGYTTHQKEMGYCYYNFQINSANNMSCISGNALAGKYYKNYLDKTYIASDEIEYGLNNTTKYENEYYMGASRLELGDINNLIILTHKNSSVLDDFRIARADRLSEISKSKLIPLNYLKSRKINVLTFDKNPDSESMLKTLRRAVGLCEKSTLLIIRGGGSKKDFLFYNDGKAASIIEQGISDGSISNFLCSVGHAKDITSLGNLSYINAITPTDLGHKFADKEYSDKIKQLYNRYCKYYDSKCLGLDNIVQKNNESFSSYFLRMRLIAEARASKLINDNDSFFFDDKISIKLKDFIYIPVGLLASIKEMEHQFLVTDSYEEVNFIEVAESFHNKIMNYIEELDGRDEEQKDTNILKGYMEEYISKIEEKYSVEEEAHLSF